MLKLQLLVHAVLPGTCRTDVRPTFTSYRFVQSQQTELPGKMKKLPMCIDRLFCWNVNIYGIFYKETILTYIDLLFQSGVHVFPVLKETCGVEATCSSFKEHTTFVGMLDVLFRPYLK